MLSDIWWALVIVAVCLKSSGYCEGQLVRNGECGSMGCFERLWREILRGALVNVAHWAVTGGYGEGDLVCTGECCGMDFIERLWRGTVGGHW